MVLTVIDSASSPELFRSLKCTTSNSWIKKLLETNDKSYSRLILIFT